MKFRIAEQFKKRSEFPSADPIPAGSDAGTRTVRLQGKRLRLAGAAGAAILVTLLMVFRGCILDKPEYISKTSAAEFVDLVTLFSSRGYQDPKSFSEIFYLDVRPDYYYEQNVPFCGGFSIAGILSAYELRAEETMAAYMSRWGQLFGGMSPKSIKVSFNRHSLEAEVRRAGHLKNSDKIALLREEIDSGRPVMLLVSNGYRKDGTFSMLKSQGLTSLHWITLWGYHENGFFIYDSAVHPYRYEPVPIGNVERSNAELLRDWSGPVYLSPFLGNTYIVIESPYAVLDFETY